MTSWQRVGNGLDAVSVWVSRAGFLWLIVWAFLLTFETISRKYFGFTTNWIFPFAKFLVVLYVYLTIAYTMKMLTHVRVVGFLQWFPPATRLWLDFRDRKSVV